MRTDKQMERDLEKEFLEKNLFSKQKNILHFINEHLLGWKDHTVNHSKFGEINMYHRVCATGDFKGNFDYGRGLVAVDIDSYISTSKSKTGEFQYQSYVTITNIDDGVWSAESAHFKTLEEANELTKKVIKSWDGEIGHILPIEEKLNEFLRPFGLWGVFTG